MVFIFRREWPVPGGALSVLVTPGICFRGPKTAAEQESDSALVRRVLRAIRILRFLFRHCLLFRAVPFREFLFCRDPGHFRHLGAGIRSS